MSPRIAILAAVAALAVPGLAACGSNSEAANDVGVGGDGPLPTIGLGSEIDGGRLTGGAEVRQIDTGAVEQAVMIGDSITVGATPYIQEQFATLGLPLTIVAQTGKRIDVNSSDNPGGTSVAQFIAGGLEGDGDETLWIVGLGTNDIGQYATVEEIEAEIEELLVHVPEDAPLVWINTYVEDRDDRVAMVNEAIDRVIGQRGNAVIGDWLEIAVNDGVLRSDGIHPSDIGAQYFAWLAATTVADFLDG